MEKKWDSGIPIDLKGLFVSGTYMSASHERVNTTSYTALTALGTSKKFSDFGNVTVLYLP